MFLSSSKPKLISFDRRQVKKKNIKMPEIQFGEETEETKKFNVSREA